MPTQVMAATYAGSFCPQTADFGYVHGPAAAMGSVEVMGTVSVPMGTVVGIQMGASTFIGFTVQSKTDQMAATGLSSRVTIVDWRDRLNDNYVFCAFNVQDNDGRMWHILPANWATQARTWCSNELGQQDFQQAQNLPPNQNILQQIANNTVFSAATLVNWLALVFNFQWNAESYSKQILAKARPLNLDWNAGVTGADALTQILAKCGLQFTAYGMNQVYISLRGFSNNAFVNAYLNGDSICTTGAFEGSVGLELNDKGQRVIILGDRNKYQHTYVCFPDWNPMWTWAFCYNSIQLSTLLRTNGLTLRNKLKEMPAAYQDFETWVDFNDWTGKGALPARVSRNEMLIEDYLNKVCWKTYVVDAETVVQGFQVAQPNISGNTFTIDPKTLKGNLNGPPASALVDWKNLMGLGPGAAVDFYWPLSSHLLTDSNAQYMALATSQKIINGVETPLEEQLVLVPKSDGHALSVEEYQDKTGTDRYRVRVVFNEVQVWIDRTKAIEDPTSVQPDTILIPLCLEKEIFNYWQGATQDIPRVRTQKQSVRGLYQAFLNGQEIQAIAVNFLQNIKANGGQVVNAAAAMKALDVAKVLAQQLLFHLAINKSGSLKYYDVAGYTPDGLIDAVNVSFDAEQGCTENVSFSTGWLDLEFNHQIFNLRVSSVLKQEDDIIRDRLLALNKAAMQDREALKKIMALFNSGISKLGSVLAGAPLMGAFGGGEGTKKGAVQLSITNQVLNNIATIQQGDVLVVGKQK